MNGIKKLRMQRTNIFTCKNTGRICLFTSTGQMHTIKVLDLPYGKFRDKGIPIDNVSNFSQKKAALHHQPEGAELMSGNFRHRPVHVKSGGRRRIRCNQAYLVAATKLAEGDAS